MEADAAEPPVRPACAPGRTSGARLRRPAHPLGLLALLFAATGACAVILASMPVGAAAACAWAWWSLAAAYLVAVLVPALLLVRRERWRPAGGLLLALCWPAVPLVPMFASQPLRDTLAGPVATGALLALLAQAARPGRRQWIALVCGMGALFAWALHDHAQALRYGWGVKYGIDAAVGFAAIHGAALVAVLALAWATRPGGH